MAGLVGSGRPVLAQLAPHRVDGVAAFVGGKAPGPEVTLILRSDVELRARLALSGQRAHMPPAGALPEALLEATLKQLVGEALIAREARRIRIGDVSPTAVARELDQLIDMAGGRNRLAAVLEHTGASEESLRAVAHRRAVVAAFLASNLEGVTRVTEPEIDAALLEAGASDPQAVSDTERRLMAARLARAALQRGVEHWVRVLRARVPVRVCTRFEPR